MNGIADSYSWVCLFIALLPFLFIFKMQRRERAWIIGLTAIYFFIGVFLTVLMNTSLDRQSSDESKVVFTASHAIVSIMIGYGLALMAAYMSTHYEKYRRWGLSGRRFRRDSGTVLPRRGDGQDYISGPAGHIGLFSLPHYIIQAFAKRPIWAAGVLPALITQFGDPSGFHHWRVAGLSRWRGPVVIFLALPHGHAAGLVGHVALV